VANNLRLGELPRLQEFIDADLKVQSQYMKFPQVQIGNQTLWVGPGGWKRPTAASVDGGNWSVEAKGSTVEWQNKRNAYLRTAFLEDPRTARPKSQNRHRRDYATISSRPPLGTRRREKVKTRVVRKGPAQRLRLRDSEAKINPGRERTPKVSFLRPTRGRKKAVTKRTP